MYKIYSLLGFAQKAGKISAGTTAVKSSLTRRNAHLLVMSNDIADNSKEMLENICQKVDVPYLTLGSKYELGKSVGKAYRVAITINDKKMAQAIWQAFHEKGEKRETVGVVEWPE